MGACRHGSNLYRVEPSKAGAGATLDAISRRAGVNHLAYEVDDVEALCQRMMSAGYQDSRHRTRIPTASAGISTIRRATIGSSSSTSLTSPLSATITRCRIDRHVLVPASDEAGLKRNQKWGLRG